MASDLMDVIAGFFDGGQYVTIGKKYRVTMPDGTKKTFKNKKAYDAWKKQQQDAIRQRTAAKRGQGGTGQRPQPQRPQPQRQPPQRPVTQANIAQAIRRVPPQNRPALMQGILTQQQQNIAQGMPFSPYGVQQPYGYAQPGYPAGFPVPMQQGFPGGYMQDEYFEDEAPEDLAESYPDEDYEGIG